MTVHLDMGSHTFGDVTADVDGALLPHAVVIRNLIDQAALADELGVDFIGHGEHHRADFAVSAPEIVLAAVASRAIALEGTAAGRRCSARSSTRKPLMALYMSGHPRPSHDGSPRP